MAVQRGFSGAAAMLTLLALGACHPPHASVEGRPLLKSCEFAAIQQDEGRGLIKNLYCPDLWRLHIRMLLVQNRTLQAVASFRQWADSNNQERAALRHLALSFIWWGLRHQDAQVRVSAVQAARLVDAASLRDDVAALLNDPDEEVRSWAAVNLANTAAGRSALISQLRSRAPTARAVATRALGRIVGQQAIPTLERMVIDPDERVRSATAVGLAATGHNRALPLLALLSRDVQAQVRADAITALGSVANSRSYRSVRRALRDSSALVRAAAVRALARFKLRRAEKDLKKIASGDDLSLALLAAVPLSRLGRVQPALNAIATAMRDSSPDMRIKALQAAAVIKDRVALKLTRPALTDARPRVKLAAARVALAHGARQEAARVALDLEQLACGSLKKGMDRLCLHAVTLLLQARHRRGLPAMIALSKQSASHTTRVAALRIALSKQTEVDLALFALTDPAPQIRLAAASWILTHVP